ncbi:hypothetical protein BT96DRAFT_950768 [Gymnopus androsaceus JB14]|uniref:Uncharacterized protein n=1 Tax=Gymnopus androsaceus JB14 TaxID=1447944 RepID=A0A6A4GF18_9AGAR|nr:hypothetical protein BT96DRAFT_950768 [Gymnopus androsaceus JB14]
MLGHQISFPPCSLLLATCVPQYADCAVCSICVRRFRPWAAGEGQMWIGNTSVCVTWPGTKLVQRRLPLGQKVDRRLFVSVLLVTGASRFLLAANVASLAAKANSLTYNEESDVDVKHIRNSMTGDFVYFAGDWWITFLVATKIGD